MLGRGAEEEGEPNLAEPGEVGGRVIHEVVHLKTAEEKSVTKLKKTFNKNLHFRAFFSITLR